MKLRDKLWIWGHRAGSHNSKYGFESFMSPVEAAVYLGVSNVFMVSLKGNIVPPFDKFSRALSVLREIKYSVVGDSSSPDNASSFGDTEEIIRQANLFDNITGGIFDDFYSERRLKVYTPEVLGAIRRRLNSNKKPLDMWSVIYDHNLNIDAQGQIDAFDGLSYWTWRHSDLDKFESNYGKFLALTPEKRRMLGCYLYDYGTSTQVPAQKIVWQLDRYTECIKKGEAEGIIFCSNTVADLGFEAVAAAKEWIAKHGDTEID